MVRYWNEETLLNGHLKKNPWSQLNFYWIYFGCKHDVTLPWSGQWWCKLNWKGQKLTKHFTIVKSHCYKWNKVRLKLQFISGVVCRLERCNKVKSKCVIEHKNGLKLSWVGGSPSPGLVVMGGDSCSKGRGFESRRRILDGHNIFSHIFVVKIVMFVWRDKNKWKRGREWPIFFIKKLSWVVSQRISVEKCSFQLCLIWELGTYLHYLDNMKQLHSPTCKLQVFEHVSSFL